jgi:hypothetical protein
MSTTTSWGFRCTWRVHIRYSRIANGPLSANRPQARLAGLLGPIAVALRMGIARCRIGDIAVCYRGC